MPTKTPRSSNSKSPRSSNSKSPRSSSSKSAPKALSSVPARISKSAALMKLVGLVKVPALKKSLF